MPFLFKDYSGGDATTAAADYYKYLGGTLRIWVQATDYDGGSVTFEASADNGANWIGLDEITGDPASFNANKVTELVKLATGDLLRSKITGSSGSISGLNVKVDV